MRRWYIKRGSRYREGIRDWHSAPVVYERNVKDGDNSEILPLDVEERDDNLIITASVPGVNPEDINVTTENGALTIKLDGVSPEETTNRFLLRERTSGTFCRTITLPETVDVNQGNSEYDKGVLTISFPKQELKKAKRVQVKVKS